MSRPTPGRTATAQYPRPAQADLPSRSRSTGSDPKPQIFTPPPEEEERHKEDIARRNWRDPTSARVSRVARPNPGGSAGPGRWHVEEVLAEEFPGLEQQLTQLGTIKPDLVKRYRDVSALPKRDYTTAIRDMLPKLGSDATENPQWDEGKADAARRTLIASVREAASEAQEAFKAHFEAGSKTGDTGESKTEQQQTSAAPDERSGATNDTRSDERRATNTAAEDERMRKNKEDGDRRAEEARKRRQAREEAEQEEKEKEQRQGRTSGSSPHTGGNTSSFPGPPPPFGSFGSGLPASPASFSSAGSASTQNVAAAWDKYDKAWTALPNKAAQGPLRWRDIPWPMVTPPSKYEDLVTAAIAKFVLSPTHNQSKSPKERIREELLRWHPDRFESRWLPKCAEKDREEIKEGAGFVVRCLNELLSVDGAFGSPP